MQPPHENSHDETGRQGCTLAVGFTSEGWPRWVTLTETTPLGGHVTRLTPDKAEDIARTMLKAAKRARSGIVTPGDMP